MTEPSLEKRLSSAGEAWLSLKNPRTSDKMPVELQRQGSAIKLTKNSELVEIIIPPSGVDFGLTALLSVVIALNIPLLVIFYEEQENLVFLIIGILLAAVGVVKFLDMLFGERRLRIDGHQISYVNNLLGLQWHCTPPTARGDIRQLEIEQIESTIPFTGQKLRRVSLIVQAGDQKYRVGEKQKLNEAEIERLATELSQWLGLKIKRTLTYREFIRWYV
jgi:hypothetical protein